MSRVYLSGPMSGIPDHNKPAFHARAAEFRALVECDAIAVLPGWQRSEGASLEVAIAKALRLPVYDASTFAPYADTILSEATRHVTGARNQDYGHPLDNHTCTADLWSRWLERRFAIARAFEQLRAGTDEHTPRIVQHRDPGDETPRTTELL